MKGIVILWIVMAALVQAAEPPENIGERPAGLAICCYDAARWVRTQRQDPKDPTSPMVRKCDKDGKPEPEVVGALYLYFALDRKSGAVVRGFVAPMVRPKKGSARTHVDMACPVDVQGLVWREGRLSGKLGVTIGPQRVGWGQLYPALCTLELDVKPGSDGAYHGRYGEYEVKGKVTGETMITPDLSKPCETTLYVHDAVNYREMGGGGASTGGFSASWKDGKIVTCFMGDCYGYNIWEMTIVDSTGLTLRDGKLSGVLVGRATSTYNAGTSGDYRWTIEAVIVGDRVIGNGRAVKTPLPEHQKKYRGKEYDIGIAGLIANSADIPDPKTWWMDVDIRAKQAAGDEGYWKGRNPNKPKDADKKPGTP